MKIKKTFQGVIPENKILNAESISQTDTYSCDYINEKSKEIYSTEEQVVGTWIDGKPLYRRTLTGNYTENVDTLILSKGNIDFLIVKKCIARMSAGATIQIPYGNPEFIWIWYFDNEGLKLVNAKAGTKTPVNLLIGQPYKCIVEYTKTTD